MWREVLKTMNEASVEGLVASGYETHEQSFLKALRHSNEVFSAFKVHSMGTLMQERLLDEEGKLRPFDEWRKSVGGIAKHHLGSWLKTEYDTAILRAHQAADWQEFERNRDILPNLRWMPTTSPTPEEAHKDFWSRGLTLPIDDPFWADHHPANRWNCKCSLEATSEPASQGSIPDAPKAQQGLEENPRHGHTFSDKHPYYPASCGSCPFYTKGKSKVQNLIGKLFDNREKDCYNCSHIDKSIEGSKEYRTISIKERSKEILESSETYQNSNLEKFDNLQTEKLLRDKKPLRRVLSHCMRHTQMDAALDFWENPDKLKFIRESPFGEGKDLESKKAQKNLEKKRKRGVVGYNEYEYEYDGELWTVKLEKHKNGFEQPYFIGRKKIETPTKEQP